MKRRIGTILLGAVLTLSVATAVYAQEKDTKVKDDISISAGYTNDPAEVESYIYENLGLNKEEVELVYNPEGSSIDREFLKSSCYVFDASSEDSEYDGVSVLVNKKTFKLYTYDAKHNLIPMNQ